MIAILKELIEDWRTLVFTLKEICAAGAKTCCILTALVLLQGLLPAFAIAISSSVINDFARGTVTAEMTLMLCLQWAGALGLYHLLSPWVLFLESNLADRCVFKVNDSIIKKATAVQELGPFEDAAFHNDLKLIQTQSSHKPINLIVTLVGLLKDGVVSISCIVLLFTGVSWIAAMIVACTYLQCRIFARIQRDTWKDTLGRSQDSRRMAYLTSLSVQRECAKEVRCYNLGPFLEKEHANTFQAMHRRTRAFRLSQVLRSHLPLLIALLGSFFVFYYVVRSALHGHTSLGSIALLLQSLAQLHLSVGAFSEAFGWMHGHLLFFQKYREFLQTRTERQPSADPQPLHTIRVKTTHAPFIRFQDVSFTYPSGQQALCDISLDIAAGERIALVGANGSGKSTLIKLLCGFYRPEHGSIIINGTSLDNLPLPKWRNDISAVFQDFHHYAFTLRQNVAMGDATGPDLDALLRQLDLDLDPDQLLDQTFGGTDLSKGQWQKIAIARAFHRNAPLYILDEPNSFLDPLTEADTFARFAALPASKTILFVTHRLGSVKLCDRIVLLNEGRVMDMGTHYELASRNQLYHSLYTAQASQYIGAERPA
jgi:ATP-binding cassette subfamily B protein